jgi:hypothetical protein
MGFQIQAVEVLTRTRPQPGQTVSPHGVRILADPVPTFENFTYGPAGELLNRGEACLDRGGASRPLGPGLTVRRLEEREVAAWAERWSALRPRYVQLLA